ncbi:MAG: beta-propeller fold lactonase family protein, partial [Vulcanimicrobiaceae bacterium]
MRRSTLILLGLATIALASCAKKGPLPSPPPPLVPKFAYVTNASGVGSVSAYTINAATGALTPVVGSPFAAGSSSPSGSSSPWGVAVDPTGKFAYVANYDATNISAYTINAATGALTPVAGS